MLQYLFPRLHVRVLLLEKSTWQTTPQKSKTPKFKTCHITAEYLELYLQCQALNYPFTGRYTAYKGGPSATMSSFIPALLSMATPTIYASEDIWLEIIFLLSFVSFLLSSVYCYKIWQILFYFIFLNPQVTPFKHHQPPGLRCGRHPLCFSGVQITSVPL